MGKRAALRQPDQKIPIFEKIEGRIEAAEVEEGLPGDKKSRQRYVVVDEELLAIETLSENAHSRMRLVRSGGADADECGDRVGVPRRILSCARCGSERVQVLGIEQIVVVEERDERRFRRANSAVHRFRPSR